MITKLENGTRSLNVTLIEKICNLFGCSDAYLMAEKDLISEGKREELLLEAYRADIVYNFDEEEANLND